MKEITRLSAIAFTLAALISLPLQALANQKTNAPRVYHTKKGQQNYNNYIKKNSPPQAPELQSGFTSPMVNRSSSERTVAEATQLFNKAAMNPSGNIPGSVIHNAAGIAIFPGKARVAIQKGGTYAKGVMLARQDNGQWSSPVFVSLASPTMQSQAGTPADVVLVFNNRSALNRVAQGNNFTLGVDATEAQGYTSSNASSSNKGAQVLGYEGTNGQFHGVSLKGSEINIKSEPTIAYYNLSAGQAGANGYQRSSSKSLYNKIIRSQSSAETIEWHPASADRLRHAIRNYVSQANGNM